MVDKQQYDKQWKEEHPDRVKAHREKWKLTHPNHDALYQRAWRAKHPEYMHEYLAKHPERRRKKNSKEYRREYAKKLKILVLTHYSGNPPKCQCCSETRIEFLGIDHKNGEGNKHRTEIGVKAGTHFYLWLKRNNFPAEYQGLCHNCNMSKGFFGYCPHEKERGEN